MTWKGDPTNPVPNPIQESDDHSEKFVGDDRSQQVRRDTDPQADFTITLLDIDEAIMTQLEQLQLQVQDVGKLVKVPVFYGSPERWTSAQRDGYLRDKQGRILLPALILKRTNSENDETLQFFNRYLKSSVIRLHSPKNQYTRFIALVGQNAPVTEIYNVVVPSHMILTYHFIIWTEYMEQMNKLVETIQFNTKDYWGSRKGFRFRTRVENYTHTVELQAGEDRMVKTEFDLTTHGYILPDTITKLERHQMTTQKFFSPKKIIIGPEVVSTEFNLSLLDKSRENWRNPNYPNIQRDVPLPVPPVNIISKFSGAEIDNSPLFLRIVPVPLTNDAAGQDGDMSFDPFFLYIHSQGIWRQLALATFDVSSVNVPPNPNEGFVMYDASYLYVFAGGSWKRVAIASFF